MKTSSKSQATAGRNGIERMLCNVSVAIVTAALMLVASILPATASTTKHSPTCMAKKRLELIVIGPDANTNTWKEFSNFYLKISAADYAIAATETGTARRGQVHIAKDAFAIANSRTFYRDQSLPDLPDMAASPQLAANPLYIRYLNDRQAPGVINGPLYKTCHMCVSASDGHACF